MTVARHSAGLRDPLIRFGAFEDHALAHLADVAALNFLPRSLRGGILITASRLELLPPALPLGLVHQGVGAAGVEVDPDAVTGLQQRQPTTCRSLRRSVEDRRASRRSRLTPVAHAREAVHALLD